MAKIAPLALILAGALPLAGCFTPHVQPQVSQAVLDARARKDVAVAACSSLPLASVSPAYARFAFNDAELPAPAKLALDQALGWLRCNPASGVAITGAADGHGTAADQQALARRRQEAAAAYLQAHGVAADRIRLVAEGQTPPADALVVQAEGRRW